MKLRSALIVLFAASLLFVSCSKKKAAIDFNNEIVAINDSIMQLGMVWGSAFKASFVSSDFTNLQPVRSKLQDFIERKIEYLSYRDVVDGAEGLKQAELQYLAFEKQAVSSQFARFERFDDATSATEIQSAVDDITLVSQREQEELARLRAAQEAFAAENGFTLNTPK